MVNRGLALEGRRLPGGPGPVLHVPRYRQHGRNVRERAPLDDGQPVAKKSLQQRDEAAGEKDGADEPGRVLLGRAHGRGCGLFRVLIERKRGDEENKG